MTIANQAGAAFRADLNNMAAAIATQSSGATAPTTTYAYQQWADTTSGYLKQRNGTNSAWILGPALAVGITASLQSQDYTAFPSAGTGAAYTLTTSPVASALVANQRYQVTWHAANTIATPTLTRDGLVVQNLKVYNAAGAKINPSVGTFSVGMKSDVVFDGTDFVVFGVATSPISNTFQVGSSATDSQNFLLKTNADGTGKLARGAAGGLGDILVWDAAGLLSTNGQAIFNRGNVLGTVSQSAGIPTGSFIEKGSNANGTYTRWADGTQICVSTTAVASLAITTASGPLFYGSPGVITFAAAFSVVPTVTQSVVGAGGLSWSTLAGVTPTAVSQFVLSVSSRTENVSIHTVAVGRWF